MTAATTDKLYVVVRADLAAGRCAAQAVHAVIHATKAFPELAARWDNGTVVVVAVRDGQELADVRAMSAMGGATVSEPFVETGYGPVPLPSGFCVMPFGPDAAYRHVRRLPLLDAAR